MRAVKRKFIRSSPFKYFDIDKELEVEFSKTTVEGKLVLLERYKAY